jgi:hypothetical protein
MQEREQNLAAYSITISERIWDNDDFEASCWR